MPKIWPDGPRSLACVAHEEAHSRWAEAAVLFVTQLKDGEVEFYKFLGHAELNPTRAGIDNAEQQYKENCLDCD